MKKVLSLVLALAMVLPLTACTQEAADPTPTPPAETEDGGTTTPDGGATPSDVSYEMISFLENYADYRYEDHINILYLVCTTTAEFFPNSYEAFKPILEANNMSIELLGPPTYSDESLISTLESSLASGQYDLILLYPITPAAITPLLDSLWDKYHVPIVAYAFSPETGCGHYYLGTDYYTAGQVLGQSIIDYVDANSEYFDTLDTIPVAVYKNSAGAEQYQRVVGAMDVLNADGRFSLIQEYEANGEAVCLTTTETLLTTHPEVEVILTQIDNDVTGTYQAVASGTYECSDYLSIWGFDSTGAVCSLMAQDGPEGYVQGSAYIQFDLSAQAMVEFLPIVVGAAKQGELIEFTEEEQEILGSILADYYVTVTPNNVSEHWIINGIGC